MLTVLPQLDRLKDKALDILFPRWCIGCGKEGDFLCTTCRRSLRRIVALICPLCGRPQPSGVTCPSCVAWRADIDGIRSPFRFESVIREAVHQLKYRNIRALAPALAGLLRDYLADNPVPGEVLVPVPLHWKRLRERGYNQSELLGRELGRLTGLPLVTGCLTRQRQTPAQARTATVEERLRNVAGAFNCRTDAVKGKGVLLIDDVCTSGATADACAAALKAAGAISVWALVLARKI